MRATCSSARWDSTSICFAVSPSSSAWASHKLTSDSRPTIWADQPESRADGAASQQSAAGPTASQSQPKPAKASQSQPKPASHRHDRRPHPHPSPPGPRSRRNRSVRSVGASTWIVFQAGAVALSWMWTWREVRVVARRDPAEMHATPRVFRAASIYVAEPR